MLDTEFPGADLVEVGLADQRRGAESVLALLVSIGAPRLGRQGLTIPNPFDQPELRLHALLRQADPYAAHSRYNALIRRLVSYEHALESAS